MEAVTEEQNVMNKVFRVIWNSATRCYTVASELATGKTKSSTTGLLATAVLLTSFSAAADTNPRLIISGGTASYDAYDIATTGTSEFGLQVNNSGDLTYTNGQATTSGSAAYVALVQGTSSLLLDNVTLTSSGPNAHVLYASGGSTVNANNLNLIGTGVTTYGINLLSGSQFTGTNVLINSTNSGILVADSTLNIDTLNVTTSGTNGYGLRYTGAATADIKDASFSTAGFGASGLLGQAGSLTGSNITIATLGDSARGILTTGANTQATVDTVNISTQGAGSYGIQNASTGTGGVSVSNATINTSGNGSSAIYTQSTTTTANNVALTTTGSSARGVLINGVGSQVTVDGGTITTSGAGSNGVQGTTGTIANISNMDLNINAVGSVDYNGATGLYSGAGAVINADSLNINANSSAMWLTGGTINANNINMVQTDGQYSAVLGGILNSTLNLTNADITLAVAKSQAMYLDHSTANLDGVRITGAQGGNGMTINNDGTLLAKNLDLAIDNVNDAENAAVLLSNGSGLNTASFEDSRLVYNGAEAIGIQATNGVQSATLKNTLLSTDGTALRADVTPSADDLTFNTASLNVTADGSSIIGQKYLMVGGQANDGDITVGDISLTATNGSQLSGDIAIDRDFTDSSTLALDNSVWKGASAGLQTLNLSNGSQWTITGDSNVGELNLNDSTLMFSHVNDNFETLTVDGNYSSNGGTLVMNSILADDGSAHDNLKITGDTSGDTNVVMNKAGGSGAQTIQGIEVISVGGNSAGEFNQQGRIVAGAYDYHLVRGTGSNNKNWYLISDTNVVAPVDPVVPVDPVTPIDPAKPVDPVTPVDPAKPVDPVTPVDPAKPVDPVTPVDPAKPVDPVTPVDPAKPVDPVTPVDPAKPVEPGEEVTPVKPVVPVDAVMITRPEAGSYLANIAAANNMFTLRLQDRGAETLYRDAITGEQKTTTMWMRNLGGHNTSTDSSGQLKTQTNRYVLQIGGELGKWSFDGNDSLSFGAMAGYGNAQSNTDSKVTGHRSKGQVNGYSVGLYSTWYQNAATQTGMYLDSWAQYSWFNNSVKGDDLPQESYKSKGVSASVESGYRWKVGEDSAKNSYFIEPNAQFVWSNIKADDLTESNGTQVSSQGSGNLQSRVGVRASMKTHSEKQQASFQPYIEANWISNTQNAGATLNDVSIEQRGGKNIAEVRAGVDGKVSERVNLWGNIGQQMGSESYRDSSAMVGVKVSF
ncbi:autotransporter outer membrane beta-barrel domain-containing protein [Ewingella americana]|uniref:Phage tail collar protein n=2 Tax=Ewingella americana TaxID=41202 RepID=A0A085G5C3_EWIA3|nr:autotransporter outer membrane beta-barrel domain-containing protein [Ewingella americana]KFC78918.1 phage tail collar protein [Ewingella americana ATCC 33852]